MDTPTNRHIEIPSPLYFFSDAAGTYARNFFTFLLIVGIPVLLLFALVFGVFGLTGAEEGLLTPGLLFSPAVFLGVVIFGAIVVLFQFWGSVALLYEASLSGDGGFFRAYQGSFSRIGSYFWIGIISFLALLAGFTFFLLPGAVLWVGISFAFFVFFAESIKGFDSLARSWDYVRGNWWDVFFQFVCLFSLNAAVLYGLDFAFSFISFSFGAFVLFIVFVFILFPFSLLYMSRLFETLRSRKPWVTEGLIHDRVFVLLAVLGALLVFISPLLAARGVTRFLPSFSFGFLNELGEFVIFGFSAEGTTTRSGLNGEDLSALQVERDEARASEISSLAFVFETIASENSMFCRDVEGKIFKSTMPSGGGTQWLPVDLARAGIEGPLVTHTPRDPVNTSQYHYAFACDGEGEYELGVRFEGVEQIFRHQSDGGSNSAMYEVGTNLDLIP